MLRVEAERLNISSYPALFLINGGQHAGVLAYSACYTSYGHAKSSQWKCYIYILCRYQLHGVQFVLFILYTIYTGYTELPHMIYHATYCCIHYEDRIYWMQNREAATLEELFSAQGAEEMVAFVSARVQGKDPEREMRRVLLKMRPMLYRSGA